MTTVIILQALSYVVLYAITGFGPGIILGIIVGNALGARGKESISEKYVKNIKSAADHNAQWHPTHKKWHGGK
jgi:F0F1-type ATP synthase membrane subunit c/vacuolar-type H+-ATPase subunit K